MFASRNFLLLLGIASLASMQIFAEEFPGDNPTCEGGTCEGGTEAVSDIDADVVADDDTIVNANADTDTKIDTETDTDADGGLAAPVIPDFTDGGIFVFFHLYKTGGSTVTHHVVDVKDELEENLEDKEEEKIIFIVNREALYEEDIYDSVKEVKDKGIPLFYKFHVEFPSTDYPTMVEAAPLLQAWREHAEQENVPIFITSILRDPLALSLSFFNFFHVAGDDEQDWNPFTIDLDPSEENFLKTFVPNRLCHMMYNDAHGILEAPDFALKDFVKGDLPDFMDEEELNRRNEPSFCDVDRVHDVLFESGIFDYVGITEKMSSHIMPLYMQIIFGDYKVAHDADHYKHVEFMFEEEEVPPLRKNKVSEGTKAMVARESAKDQRLYETARDRFAHWPEYP